MNGHTNQTARCGRDPLQFISRIIKGAVVGVGAILPGISGGVLSVVFGIYRPLMGSLPLHNRCNKSLSARRGSFCLYLSALRWAYWGWRAWWTGCSANRPYRGVAVLGAGHRHIACALA